MNAWMRRLGRLGAAAVLVVAVTASVVALDILADRTARTYDATGNDRLTLDGQTHAVLDQLDDTLRMRVFTRPDTTTGRDARALLERYADASSKVEVDIVDPDAEPGEVAAAGVTRYGAVVIEYGGDRVDADSANEADVTTAILRLVRGVTPTACFVTGHGESAIDDEGPQGLSTFGMSVVRNGFEAVERNLALDGTEGCDVLVVAGPRVRFADAEVASVNDFLDADGDALFLIDSLSEADLNPLIEPWGIDFLGGVVLDAASNLSNDLTTPVITDFPSLNPVVEEVPSLLLPAAAGLLVEDQQPRDGLFVSTLARSSDDSVLAADPDDPSAGALNGPIVVAAASDFSTVSGEPPVIHRTRVLVIADVAFAQNLAYPALGNARLLANGLSWLTRDERLLTLVDTDRGVAPLEVTPARRRSAFAVTVIGVPASLILAGAAITWVRRRR